MLAQLAVLEMMLCACVLLDRTSATQAALWSWVAASRQGSLSRNGPSSSAGPARYGLGAGALEVGILAAVAVAPGDNVVAGEFMDGTDGV